MLPTTGLIAVPEIQEVPLSAVQLPQGVLLRSGLPDHHQEAAAGLPYLVLLPGAVQVVPVPEVQEAEVQEAVHGHLLEEVEDDNDDG